ncbi:copper radical oxidase [Phellopilus nigrolimitatus]|nr:copper radical oxidase [Phellopilus nigrolimitatus]
MRPLYFLSILAFLSSSLAKDSAWNGHFTPFYVPAGSKAYDSTDPSIRHFGSWREAASPDYVNGSGAYATFNFTGTGGRRYGTADVYLDGNLTRSLNNWASRDQQQQLLFFSYGLSLAPHAIRLVNKGSNSGSLLDIDAFVVIQGGTPSSPAPNPISKPNVLLSQTHPPDDQWSLLQRGSTGVAAMQLSIISSSHAIIIDKVEHNPLTIDGHPAWGALYNINSHASNSFCAGGTFLSNGTLINVGGNPVVSDNTASADFGDSESAAEIRMASPRCAMIIGGSKKGGWMNNATTNNPTVEYYPPKNIAGSNGLPITLPFLKDTLNSNLFPIAFVLPNDATIYDWQANSEQRLPQIPNGVRVTYPMTGTGLLLPLSPENNYTPEILLCGGSALNSQDPASSQCSRMVLTDAGISAGWQVEQMPQARVMPDAILIVNGGASGISGYANVIDQVGASNADNPVLTPVLSAGMPTSQIPRLSEARYGTEYRVEWISPPYMARERPTIAGAPQTIGFGETVALRVTLPAAAADVKVACMDLGYVTHAVHANARLVYLVVMIGDGKGPEVDEAALNK